MPNKRVVNETRTIAELFGLDECLSSAVQERPFCYDSGDLMVCAMNDVVLLNKDKPEYSAAAHKLLMDYESWQVKYWLDVRTHLSECDECASEYRVFRAQMPKHISINSLEWFAMENLLQRIGTEGIEAYLRDKYDADQISKEVGYWSDEEIISILEMARDENENPQKFQITGPHLSMCNKCSQRYGLINASYERIYKGLMSGNNVQELLEREKLDKEKFFEMLIKQCGARMI